MTTLAAGTREDRIGKLEDELIVAEFTSLRDEVILRVEHGHRLAAFTLGAFGALCVYILSKEVPADDMRPELFLAYTLFSALMAGEWAFNNMRVGQLAAYLQCTIEKSFRQEPCPGWECFLETRGRRTPLASLLTGEWVPATFMIVGSQLASAVIAWRLGPSTNFKVAVAITSIVAAAITAYMMVKSRQKPRLD